MGWVKNIIKTITGVPKRKEEIKLTNRYQNNIEHLVSCDETFNIDFLLLRDSGETLSKAKVTFPVNNQYIIINDQKQGYFDPYNLKEEGISSDKLYQKVSTCDYRFWVTPSDYNRFMNVMFYRKRIKERRKEAMENITRNDILEKFEYDEIDSDIYKCFIAHKSSMCEAIGTWEEFYKVEDKLSDICNKNDGRYYKTASKNAKFAIIFSYTNRVASSVKDLRERGYKVTTFEKAIEHFNLEDMWDTNALTKMENKHKEFLENHYI